MAAPRYTRKSEFLSMKFDLPTVCGSGVDRNN